MHFLSLSAWVDPSVSGLYLPCVCVICSCCHSQQEWTHLWVGCICVICSCCHSRHEWTHLWVSCICIAFALYALFVPLGMSGPICEWAVSASCVHYMHSLSLSAWVNPSVSGLYLPLVCALYVLVVFLGISKPICELAVSASCVRYMFLLSLLAWVDPSVNWMYLPWICFVCSCHHSRHEWTHLWVSCICIAFALYALFVPLGMSGPICELAVSASRLHYMHFLSLSAWVNPSVSGLCLPLVCIICTFCPSRHEWTHLWVGCICLVCALYVLVVTLGMRGPICELDVSASHLLCMLLSSLSAWVDPSVSGLYLPCACVICCCPSQHEWTHLWVGCICLVWTHLWVGCICIVVTLGMSGPICEWAVSASCVRYMFLLSLSAWVDPSVNWMYLPRICFVCSCHHSWHEWTHLWVGCICLACTLYVLVVTLGMSGPICEWSVSASCVRYMYSLSLLAWVNPSVSGLYLSRVCVICTCCHSRHEWTHLWVSCICQTPILLDWFQASFHLSLHVPSLLG